MTTEGTTWAARRLGWVLTRVWHWLLARWRGPAPLPAPPPPPPPPPPGRHSERRVLQSPLIVPALGYVHHFKVHAAFLWHSDGLPREVLAAHVQHFMPYATRELKAVAASCAREHSPHHAQELEVKLQQVLEERGQRRYRQGGDEVTWHPSIWVDLDDRVKRTVLGTAHQAGLRTHRTGEAGRVRRAAEPPVAGGAHRPGRQPTGGQCRPHDRERTRVGR